MINLDVRFGIVPLPQFLLELLALVDEDLAVVADADGPAFQRPGSRAFEVDAGDLEAAAVAGALELLFALQPVRRAAQVGAGRAQGVDDALVTHHPEVLILEAIDDLAFLVLVRQADLDLARRLGEYVGKQEAHGAEHHANSGNGQSGPGDGEPAAEQGKEEEASFLARLGRCLRWCSRFGRQCGFGRRSGRRRFANVRWLRHDISFYSWIGD